MQKLVSVLEKAGKPAEVYKSPDGTRLLVLPHGGRVLGLFAPNSEENFYWTNPALAAPESARAFYASASWHNSGGDRTWLAPEVDVFLPAFPDLTHYFQPRQLDPGSFEVEKDGAGLRLGSRFTLRLSRSKAELDLALAKSVAPAPNPLRYERGLNLAGLEYAGYTQQTSLAIVNPRRKTGQVGLWNLVQMPHPGELLVPTYFKASPKIVFGSIPSEDLAGSDHLLRYRMRQLGAHKLSIRAVATTGRVGYLFAQGGRWSLIVRNFAVNPSGEYVDVPWTDPEDRGYSTQACNVNNELGSFNELEYHIPAVGGEGGPQRCEDTTQIWAFRGERPAIASVVHHLLSPEM